MSDINAPQPVAPIAPEPIPAATIAQVESVAEVAVDLAEEKPVDPAQVVQAVVTSESLLAELVAVVRRDASGISHSINDLLSKAEKHFGL
jgi:hypothetical protein